MGRYCTQSQWRRKRWALATVLTSLLGLWLLRVGTVDLLLHTLPVSVTLGTRTHVAVCVLGQVGRLELESKVENLLDVNVDIELNLFLVLDPMQTVYSKQEYEVSREGSKSDAEGVLNEARRLLGHRLKGLILLNDTSSFSYVDSYYERYQYLGSMPEEDRLEMLRKHLKQFYGHYQCAQVISDEEMKHNIKYEMVLRVRDNSIVVQPFKLPTQMLRKREGAYVKDCSDWGGVNDKIMLVSRRYVDPAFRSWITHFMFHKSDHSALDNPEKFLEYVLRAHNVPLYRLSVEELPFVDGRVHNAGKSCLVTQTKDCRPSIAVVNEQYPECKKIKTTENQVHAPGGHPQLAATVDQHMSYEQLRRLIWGSHDVFHDFHVLENATMNGWGPGEAFYDTILEFKKVQIALEVGVWKGQSAIYIAEAMKKRDSNSVLVAMDTWLGSLEFLQRNSLSSSDSERQLHHVNGYPHVYYHFLSNMYAANLTKNIIPFPIPSDIGHKFFYEAGVRFDLIHIDASHEYLAARRDVNIFWTILNAGGLLLGDDFTASWPGVVQAVCEFALERNLHLSNSYGKWWIQKQTSTEEDVIDADFLLKALIGIDDQSGRSSNSIAC